MAALEIGPDGFSNLDWRGGLPPIANSRVTLRELRRSDATLLYQIVHRPEVARYMWPPPPTIEALEKFIEWTWAERAAGRYVSFGIVPPGEVHATGFFELRPLQPGFFRAELGFFLSPSWWGTGLFPEAARLVRDFAFQVLGVHRIEARVSVDNPRGNGAMRKIGARNEGLLRAAFVSNGQYVNQHLWAIVNVMEGTSQPILDPTRIPETQ